MSHDKCGSILLRYQNFLLIRSPIDWESKQKMIVHQWGEAGASRIHLGILSRRQFELSEQSRRTRALTWLLDDFRGSWIEPDPQSWLSQIQDCVKSVSAGPALQRHAIVLPVSMTAALECLAADRAAGIVCLFDSAVDAGLWVLGVCQGRAGTGAAVRRAGSCSSLVSLSIDKC